MFKKKMQIIMLMAILLVGGVISSHAQAGNDGLDIILFDISGVADSREGGDSDDLPDSILWDLDGGHVADGDVDVPDCIIWDIDSAGQ